MTIKVIVFDLWYTLVYDPSHEIHEKIAGILGFENRHEFWSHLDERFFGTRMTFYDYIRKIIEEKNLPEETFDEIESLWEKARINVDIFPDTIETLERLSKKYKLVLLSNTAEKEGKEVIERFGLGKYFDEIIISGSVGLAKPDPRIFELVLERMNVKPEQVLMVGDNFNTDIVLARKLDMQGKLVDTKRKYTDYEGEDWYFTSLKDLKI